MVSGRVVATMVFAHHFIAEIVELAVFFLVDHFLVAEGSERSRVPVHHADTAVDEAFVEQIDKHTDNALRADFVHCERCAAPVAGSTQLFQLFEDDATVFFLPFPCVFEELLAGKVGFLDTLLCQTCHHFSFSSDRSVVGTRYPQRIFAFHAGTADKNVLNRIVEHMSHMQNAGHVWRRNDNSVRFTFVGY